MGRPVRLDAFTVVILVLIVACATLLGIEGLGRLHHPTQPAAAPAAGTDPGTVAAPAVAEPEPPPAPVPPQRGGVG
jgi:hypothetical protein